MRTAMHAKAAKPVFTAQPTFSRAAFYQPGEVLAHRYSSISPSGPEILIPDGPLLYMRFYPTEEQEPLTLQEAMDAATTAMLRPFGRLYGGFGYGSNKNGPISYETTGEKSKPQFSSLTQLFKKSRELWGVDYVLIHSQERRKQFQGDITKYIPTGYIEEVAAEIVRHYLAFATEYLGLKFPIGFEIGVTGISEFRLATRETGIMYGTVPPVIHDDEVFHKSEILERTPDPRPILRPFYKKLWGEAGLKYP